MKRQSHPGGYGKKKPVRKRVRGFHHFCKTPDCKNRRQADEQICNECLAKVLGVDMSRE